jgi:hypothetical protein
LNAWVMMPIFASASGTTCFLKYAYGTDIGKNLRSSGRYGLPIIVAANDGEQIN